MPATANARPAHRVGLSDSRRLLGCPGRRDALPTPKIGTGRDPGRDAEPMTALFDALLPSLAMAAGTVALLAVAAGMAAIGAWLAGPRRQVDGDLLYGWAAISTLFTVVGALRMIPFGIVALAALAAAAAAATMLAARRQSPIDPALLRIVALGLPLISIVGAMMPTQWDEMTNWLPNARYLFEVDAFPGPGLPPNPSVFPAYPYGLEIVCYLASRIVGHLVENAVALFNLLLLLSFGLLLARMVRGVLARPAPDIRLPRGLAAPEEVGLGWGWCAFGALAVTALSPTFVPKIVFTAYADSATAVALGFAAALGWSTVNALADGRPADARGFALQFGFAGTALLVTKQVNLVLLVALCGLLAVVVLRDPATRLSDLGRLGVRALALPIAVYAIWRLYVALNISGGEFSILPFAQWKLSLVPDILGRMAQIASKKGGYFVLMIAAAGLGLRALRCPRSPFDRLAIIAGGLFLAYNGFLLFAYVAAFGQYEAENVLSYWRYNLHLGGVALLFATYAAALLWRRHVVPRWRPRIGWVAIALVLVAPVALATKLRFDRDPRYQYARATATAIARMLTPADRLVLIDPEDNGQYLVIMRYALHGSATAAAEITAFAGATPARLRAAMAETRASHVWIYRPLPQIESALGVRLAPGSSYLLKRDGGRWTTLQSWRHPKATDR
jgi:hypothetical protein